VVLKFQFVVAKSQPPTTAKKNRERERGTTREEFMNRGVYEERQRSL